MLGEATQSRLGEAAPAEETEAVAAIAATDSSDPPPSEPVTVSSPQRFYYPILTGLAGVYLVAAVSQLLLQPDLKRWTILTLVGSTAVILAVLRWILSRKKLSPWAEESIGAVLAGLVLVNTLLHVYYLSGTNEVRNLILLGMGIACFFLSSSRLALVLASTLGIWVIVAWAAGATPAWLHFAFGLFAAAGLRLHTEFRQSRLKIAYTAAEIEIKKREEVERALRESEERYALAAEGSNDGLWDWDLKTNRAYFSPRWREMIGCANEEIGEHPNEWLHRVHPQDRAHVRSALLTHIEGQSPHFESEYRLQHVDGEYRWMLCRGLAVRDADGKAHRIAGSQTDCTGRKLAEQQLIYDAFHDHLTGLPNRALFLDRLNETLKRGKRYKDMQFALLFLDLDRFKIINDSLGHLAGDELLKAMARRLEACVRTVDTVARFGGDEFAVLLGELHQPSDAVLVAGRIQKKLEEPFTISGQQIFSSASVGIVLSSSEYQQPDEMLRDADTAMYRAKIRAKGSCEVFNGDMLASARSVLQLENEMRTAIPRQEFCLFYQPIVSLQSGKIRGFEALLRWKHPERGLLPPAQFLSVAEDADLLVPIGWQMLRLACKQMQTWHEKFPDREKLSLNFNLSARQFLRPDLIDRIEQTLYDTQLSPSSLRVEITEGVVMSNMESSSQKLHDLRAKGIQIHLDDFGTGYSALSYLHMFPVNALKTDRSFLAGDGISRENKAVLRAILQLAESLNLDVVVEGVENVYQMREVIGMNCRLAQGYLFSRPVDPEKADLLLEEDRDLRPAPADQLTS